MRIDVVSIFPDYLAPLRLSLPGKAIDSGLLDLQVHDLRQWTHDRHRTVDDTPYGGGAGMVMRPEPWGEALDELLSSGQAVLVVPTPSGVPFTQRLAEGLSAEEHLVFACGRYEGIDQRVLDHAAGRARVVEVSLGDYVLNGGEVAAMAVVEAVVRLLPGFMGNPESLAEESHAAGLLEYPVYTKPASWRGLDVPEVLLSGDHARIARWRHEQSVVRTAHRRPDLLHPSGAALLPGGAEVVVGSAAAGDSGELLTLQWACGPERLPGEEILLPDAHVVTARAAGRLVGAARGRVDGQGGWLVDLVLAAPDLPPEGLRDLLVEEVLRVAPAEVTAYVLELPETATTKPWERAGWRRLRGQQGATGTVRLGRRAG